MEKYAEQQIMELIDRAAGGRLHPGVLGVIRRDVICGEHVMALECLWENLWEKFSTVEVATQTELHAMMAAYGMDPARYPFPIESGPTAFRRDDP